MLIIFFIIVVGLPAYSCSRCGRNYMYMSNLTRHQRLECGVTRQYECNTCSKKFKHKHHLDHHYSNVHSGTF